MGTHSRLIVPAILAAALVSGNLVSQSQPNRERPNPQLAARPLNARVESLLKK